MSEHNLSFRIDNPRPTISFFSVYNEPPIAKFWIEDNALHFAGNMDEAARMFLDQFLKPICDNYIKAQLESTKE